MIRYTSRIGGWDEKTATPEDFHTAQLLRWGDPDFQVRSDTCFFGEKFCLPTTPHTCAQACELLEGNTWVNPVFDYDCLLEHEPDAATIQEHLGRCQEEIATTFPLPGFNLEENLLVASRHGFVASKRKWKISFHLMVVKFCKIPFGQIPSLIKKHGSRDAQDIWDMSLYSSRRLLSVPGACKGGGDTRVLDMDKQQARYFLAQYLSTGQEIPFEDFVRDDGSNQQPSGEGTEEAGSLMKAGWFPPEPQEAMRVLAAAGFRGVIFRGASKISLHFTCDALGGPCLCCQLQHDRQNWYALCSFSDVSLS